jgi:hypothetical protein
MQGYKKMNLGANKQQAGLGAESPRLANVRQANLGSKLQASNTNAHADCADHGNLG